MRRGVAAPGMQHWGLGLLTVLIAAILAAPFIAPHGPSERFDDRLYAPPTRVHLWDEGIARPFIYEQRLVSRIERRYDEDHTRKIPLRWFAERRLVTTTGSPLLLLGADSYGRDIFTRVLYGGRISLALALLAAACAVGVGALLGGIAGYAGGRLDVAISRSSEFLLVLPTMYVVLVLRAVLPDVLDTTTVFVLLTVIFAVLGSPIVARGTRAIVVSERDREYVQAARAVGMAPGRILIRHLLPATVPYLLTQLTLLVPAFILAEATLSFVNFGFPPATPTWGTMLQEAANVLVVNDAPWLLAPAGAIFLTALAINLLVQATGRPPVQLEG